MTKYVELEKVRAYICPTCYELHGSNREAIECCPYDVDSKDVYLCPTCEKMHESKTDGMMCCPENAEIDGREPGIVYQIQHEQLELAGQERMFA